METKLEIQRLTRFKSVAEISECLDLSKKTIRGVLAAFPSLKPRHHITPDFIREVMALIPSFTNGEIAVKLNVPESAVRRVIAQYSLRRTREQDNAIRSRVRKNLYAAERRRVLFGFEQQTDLKVFSNRERNVLRGMLRKLSYIVKKNEMTVYYDQYTRRNETYEVRGSKLGLTFVSL